MKNILFIAIISMTFLNEIAYSQATATVQFVGGYSQPIGDYYGKFGDTRATFTGNGNPDSNSYFMKFGVNYGIFIKIPVTKKSNFSIKGGVNFHNFGQSKEYTEGGSVTVSLKQNLFAVTIGGDYDFGHFKNKLRPFIGAEFSGTFFSGSYEEDYIDSVETLELNATFRMGVNLVAGADYRLHNNIGILAGARYVYANLIGKNYDADTKTRYGLNDKSYTSGNSTYPSRNITYLQFFGGLSFYFGR